jgi:hypothetical protein
MDRCDFDGIKVRPGDRVTGYAKERSANCANEKEDIACGAHGKFIQSGSTTEMTDNSYPFSYCMPWDSTGTGIIEAYHP